MHYLATLADLAIHNIIDKYNNIEEMLVKCEMKMCMAIMPNTRLNHPT